MRSTDVVAPQRPKQVSGRACTRVRGPQTSTLCSFFSLFIPFFLAPWKSLALSTARSGSWFKGKMVSVVIRGLSEVGEGRGCPQVPMPPRTAMLSGISGV